MNCVRRTEKKYVTRPSPPFGAQQCPGMIKYGNDGNLYVSKADVKGVYHWKRYDGPDPHTAAPSPRYTRPKLTSRKPSKKRKTTKRKTSKRKTSKRKTSKRKTSKRKTSKRKTSKRKTSKRKTSKRKTSKRKRNTSKCKGYRRTTR